MEEKTSNVLLEQLNKEQQEGVYQTDGPVLILAGAGSGKTRVLTNRTAYLIEEKGVNPYHILAITFTNKAAAEMRERIDDMVGFGSSSIWVSTFHSLCVRILRKYADLVGYDKNFTIYDSDDQKAVVKDVCKRLEVNTKQYKERMFMSVISGAKNKAISPDDFRKDAGGDYGALQQAKVYSEYQRVLMKNNAMDFDDLLLQTVRLFQREEEVLLRYQERFQYIMVDEYQDTNQVQFLLIQALASRYRNLCVVGDDDQSIYKFRGADIRNILDFEKNYPDAKVIKLEQNYRSTQNILNAANGVIKNNIGRKEKALWTSQEGGDQIVLKQFDTAVEEASHIAIDIERNVRQGHHYKDIAVLYRTNAQSRLMEEKFVSLNIPYKVIGGVNFYSRKEIKDVLAYLKTIANGRDDVAVKRIINVPKRGIGATSINKVQEYALEHELNFYDALRQAEEITTLGRASAKMKPFVNFIQVLRSEAQIIGVSKVIEKVLKETGYLKNLELENTIEANVRIENIQEFMSKAVTYEEEHEEDIDNPPTLGGFLEEVALVADIDSYSENSDYVVLMTLHGAKGLEFPYVYMTGLEDGLFPSYMSITADDPLEIEEERRLCYVGITRAKEHLTLTSARCRMVNGETRYTKVSRFVREIPQELFHGLVEPEKITQVPKTEGYRKAKQSFRSIPAAANRSKSFSGNKVKLTQLSYGIGDRVKHAKFGEGTVVEIVEGGRDFEVTVNFDVPGTKKMFATFAKLEKIL